MPRVWGKLGPIRGNLESSPHDTSHFTIVNFKVWTKIID